MFEPWTTLTVIALAFWLIAAGLRQLDQQVVARVKILKNNYPKIGKLARVLSWTPFPVFVLFVLPAGVWWLGTGQMEAIGLFLACSLAVSLAFIGKFIFHRSRPNGFITHYGEIDSSFPSAHTAGPFAAAFIIADVSPSLALFVLCFAAAVAASRVWLELHFISDLGGGLLLAYLASWLTTQTDLLGLWSLFA